MLLDAIAGEDQLGGSWLHRLGWPNHQAYEGWYASVFYAHLAILGRDMTPEDTSNAMMLAAYRTITVTV